MSELQGRLGSDPGGGAARENGGEGKQATGQLAPNATFSADHLLVLKMG